MRATQAAQAAAAAAREQEVQRLRLLRVQAVSRVGPEAPAVAADAVSVRVRLPDGSTQTRRFLRHDSLQRVKDWVASLDEGMPLLDPASWSLVLSYPRAVVDPALRVSDIAADSTQVALLVEQHGGEGGSAGDVAGGGSASTATA